VFCGPPIEGSHPDGECHRDDFVFGLANGGVCRIWRSARLLRSG